MGVQIDKPGGKVGPIGIDFLIKGKLLPGDGGDNSILEIEVGAFQKHVAYDHCVFDLGNHFSYSSNSL